MAPNRAKSAYDIWQDQWSYFFLPPAIFLLFFGLFAVYIYRTLESAPALLPAFGLMATIGLPTSFLYRIPAKKLGLPFRRFWPHIVLTAALLFAASYTGLVTANAVLDRSEFRIYETKVLAKRRGGLNGSEYFIKLESWRPGRTVETKRTDPETYADVALEQRVKVRTKPGALGWEWWYTEKNPPHFHAASESADTAAAGMVQKGGA